MKRTSMMIAILLAAALSLSACGTTMAAGSAGTPGQEMSQQSSAGTDITFSDVKPDEWYTEAIRWTIEAEIMSGYSETIFGTEDVITREQIATILYRYETYKNVIPSMSDTLAFADAATISDWAKEAVLWAAENEIVSGKSGNNFDPKANANRAEVAMMLYRYLTNEKSVPNDTEPPTEAIPTPIPETSHPPANSVVADEDGMIVVNISINGEIFAARFYDNASVRVLLEQMPFSLDMNDYAGQEKVVGLSYDLPGAATERPATISTGELYLWSGNQLVFFYTTFSNSYGGYVRIGYVEDTAGLASALGSGSVTVTFNTAQ